MKKLKASHPVFGYYNLTVMDGIVKNATVLGRWLIGLPESVALFRLKNLGYSISEKENSD